MQCEDLASHEYLGATMGVPSDDPKRVSTQFEWEHCSLIAGKLQVGMGKTAVISVCLGAPNGYHL